MSELITRRTFLKATGTAVLVTAAGGLLTGCGDNYDSTPGSPALPSIDSTNSADFSTPPAQSIIVDLGPLSGEWTSRTTYESDSWRHNYLYTGLLVDNTIGQTRAIISTSNFTCKHGSDTPTVCSLGNFGLNDAKTGFKFVTSVSVDAGKSVTIPLYIHLGPVNTAPFTKFYSGEFTISFKYNGKTAVFTYTGLSNDPGYSFS